MNLDAIGNIGELVSAIGVVVTLAYLALQIRQNSIISRANIRQQLAAQQIAYVSLVVAEPALRSAFAKIRAGETFSEDEGVAFNWYAIGGLRLFENYYAQWRYGTLPDEDWNALRNLYELQLGAEAFRAPFLRNPNIWNPRFSNLVRSCTSFRIGQTGPGIPG